MPYLLVIERGDAPPDKGECEMSNMPKLSNRAQRALDVLANGGEMVHRLERNGYTGREQFQTRFCTSADWGSVVKGLGFATRCELEKAGFHFRIAHRSSVATHYKLDTGASL